MGVNPKIDNSWKNVLSHEFEKPYFSKLKNFLVKEKEQYTIYPKNRDIFNALNTTPFNSVKVVILGQDPYHGANQAHGLAFSVQDNIKLPPSLVNIFKELQSDLNMPFPKNGDLTRWAKNGVFLLNTVLTVRANSAHSHKDKGWEYFTDAIIKTISSKKEHIVFILWGSHAQKKASLIDKQKHLILSAPHPSPLSSYRGFFGSKPFSKTNKYLKAQDLKPVDWSL